LFGNPAALVVEQAGDTRHRRTLLDEEREPRLDPPFVGMQPFEHRGQMHTKLAGVERAAGVERLEPLDKTRHVRALALGGQRNVQIPQRAARLLIAGDGQAQRVAHVLDAHALDREPALIALALGIRDVQGRRQAHEATSMTANGVLRRGGLMGCRVCVSCSRPGGRAPDAHRNA
jgi:hypothetical protein